jgi:molybdopterin synthase sulfur carrier subunit
MPPDLGQKINVMKIHVYAALKDHFEPEFELVGAVQNTDELKLRLQGLNASAGELLKSCRFAVEEGFIDNDYKLKEHDTVIIIPPSSGG